MAMITMTNVGEALKVHYLPVIQDQMNNKLTPFYAQIAKDSKDVVGSKAVFAAKYGRNGGVGNRADDGNLPFTNPRKVKQLEIVTKNIFARTQFTQKVIDASKSSEGSFVNVLTSELEDVMKDAKEQFARQLHGDGSGIFATVGTAGSTTAVIPVTNIESFAVGMLIDITHASASTTVKYGGTTTPLYIDDVNYDNSTITLTADPGDTASGDGICVNGSAGLELTGLKKVFSTDDLYGISRTGTNSWAVPTSLDEAGEIDEISMQTVLDRIDTRSGGDPNFLMCSKGVKRAYLKMQQAFKRNTEYMDIKGGFNVMSFAGKPFVDDKYAAAGEIKFLSLADWKIHRMADWAWLDKDGSIFERVAGKAAWEASLYNFSELATSRPGGNGRLYNITEQ